MINIVCVCVCEIPIVVTLKQFWFQLSNGWFNCFLHISLEKKVKKVYECILNLSKKSRMDNYEYLRVYGRSSQDIKLHQLYP